MDDKQISIGKCRQCKEDIFAGDETCYEISEAGALYCADCCHVREPGDIYVEQLEDAYGKPFRQCLLNSKRVADYISCSQRAAMRVLCCPL